MAPGLTDHLWSVREPLLTPVFCPGGRRSSHITTAIRHRTIGELLAHNTFRHHQNTIVVVRTEDLIYRCTLMDLRLRSYKGFVLASTDPSGRSDHDSRCSTEHGNTLSHLDPYIRSHGRMVSEPFHSAGEVLHTANRADFLEQPDYYPSSLAHSPVHRLLGTLRLN